MSNAPQSEAEGTQEFLDALLLESAWVHALARRLVRHAEDPEELAQETMLAALERPPSLARPLRAWLAGVAQRILRRQRRSRLHREDREARVASGSEVSQDALVERSLLHEELVVAVRELPESQRTVVLLRYLEGLQPRSIARRLGVPVGTVRSRLSRALDRLRDRFDEGHGGRGAWLPVLAIRTPKGVLFPTLVSAMSSKTLSGFALAVVLIPLLLWARGLLLGNTSPEARGPLGETSLYPSALGGPGVDALPDPGGSRARVAEGVDATPSVGPRLGLRLEAEETGERVSGELVFVPRPVDSEGRPLGIPVSPMAVEVSAWEEVSCELEAGMGYRVHVTPKDSRYFLGGTEIDVAPLTQGEEQELVIRLQRLTEREFHMRIVDAESSRPLVGAQATLVTLTAWSRARGDLERLGNAPVARSDSSGRTQIRYPVETPSLGYLTLEGYGPRLITLHDSHGRIDDERQVRLQRGFRLAVNLKRPIREFSRGAIVIEANPSSVYDDPGQTLFHLSPRLRWTRDLGSVDRIEFDGLPPGIELTLHLEVDGDSRPVKPRTLVGEPGESRVLDLELDTGTRVRGVLRDLRGDPVAGAPLIWSPALDGKPPLALGERENSWNHASTDVEGRFEFESVPRGSWWLGLPASSVREARRAGWNLPVYRADLDKGQEELHLELEMAEGLMIRGRVTGADGIPNPGDFYVEARSRYHSSIPHGNPIDQAGTFEIGPLPPGGYELEARGFGNVVGATILADAGDDGVELTLPASATVRGTLVKRDKGSVQHYRLAIIPEDGGRTIHHGSISYPETFEPRQSFERGGIMPGRYTLVATTFDGYIGTLDGLEVGIGGVQLSEPLVLDPGARLRIKCAGQLSFEQLRFEREGREVPVPIPPRSGPDAWVSVPVGPLVVTSTPDAPVEFHRTLVLEAGRVTVLRVP